MNLGCLLWVIVGMIILWNISPGLVVVSVLGGIVAAIVKMKGNDIDGDKKISKEDDNYFQPQVDSFPKFEGEKQYDKRLYGEIEEIPEKEFENMEQKSVYLEEEYEPKYKYCNNLTSSTGDIDLNAWDSLSLPMDKICGIWKYKYLKYTRTIAINSNMTYSDSYVTRGKSCPFAIDGKHICFYEDNGKLLSSWRIVELSKENILHVVLRLHLSGEMFEAFNRPVNVYLEKVGDSLI